jgi:hypothetical protein
VKIKAIIQIFIEAILAHAPLATPVAAKSRILSFLLRHSIATSCSHNKSIMSCNPGERYESFRRHLQFLSNKDEDVQQEEEQLMALFDNSDNDINLSEHAPIFNHIPNKESNSFSGHMHLMADYFDDEAIYSNLDFDCRFQVTKGVFFCLCNDLQTKNSTVYFIERPVSFTSFLFNIELKLKLSISFIVLHWEDGPLNSLESDMCVKTTRLWAFL